MTACRYFCDKCGKEFHTTNLDFATVSNHSHGVLKIDLCWECSLDMYAAYDGLKLETKNRLEGNGA